MGRVARPKPERFAEKLLQIHLALELSQDGMLTRLGLDGKLFCSAISSLHFCKRECEMNAPGWTRTSGPLLRRQMLYPLSYGSTSI
jgi:hypothetical protein